MNYIQGFQNELLIIGGALIVMFLAIEKFDTWPASDNKDEGAQPPRSFTTFGRYLIYCSLYVVGFELVYLFFTFFPDLARTILGTFDITPTPIGGGDQTESTVNLAPLWALSALVAILSAPVLKAVEPMIRARVHRKAAIRSAVELVVRLIQFQEGLFRPDSEKANMAIEATGVKYLDSNAASERHTTISHKWFRAIYLYHAINAQTDPAFGRFLSDGQEEFGRIEKFFESMKEEMEAFLKQRGKNQSRAPERWGRSLEKGLDDLLNKTYLFIVCGVYKTRKSENERRKLLESFDIFVDTRDRVPFAADVVVKSVVVIAISAIVPTAIYLFLLRDVVGNQSVPAELRALVPVNQWWAMFWVAAGLLMHGAAICAVVLARRWFVKPDDKGRVSGGRDSDGSVTGGGATASRVAVMGLLGYGASLIVLFGMSLAAGTGWLESLQSAVMWSLAAAVTSSFTFVYVVRAAEERKPRPVRDVALHASIMAAVSLFLCLFVPGTLDPDIIHLWFAAYVLAASTLIGGGIAYVFPSGYYKHQTQLRKQQYQEVLDAAHEKLTKIEREYGVVLDNYFMDESAEDQGKATSFMEQCGREMESDLEKIVKPAYSKLVTPEIREVLEGRVQDIRDYLGPRLAFVSELANASTSDAEPEKRSDTG